MVCSNPKLERVPYFFIFRKRPWAVVHDYVKNRPKINRLLILIHQSQRPLSKLKKNENIVNEATELNL